MILNENEPGPEIVPEKPTEPVKRGRGRPRIVREDAPSPDASININASAEARPRGRPPGKTASKKHEVDIPALATQLQFAHRAAALVFKTPELALDKDDCETLAKSLAALMREYDIALSGKTAALLGMLGACAMTYGPVFMLVKERKAKERANIVDVQIPQQNVQ